MKWLLTISFVVNITCCSYAQYSSADSLKKLLDKSHPDTNRVLLQTQLAHAYLYYKPDSSVILAKTSLLLAKKLGFARGEARSYKQLGDANEQMGNYPSALNYYLMHLRMAERLNMQFEIGQALTNIGLIYHDQGEERLAVKYTLTAKTVLDGIKNTTKIKNYAINQIVTLLNAGYYYYKLNMPDSALYYEQTAYELSIRIHNNDNLGNILQNLGLIQQQYKNNPLAVTYFRMSAQKSAADKDYTTLADTYLRMSEFYKSQHNQDSSVYYAREAFRNSRIALYTKGIMESSDILAGIYSQFDKATAYDYLNTATAAKDSLFNGEKIKQIQNLKFDEQTREQELNELKTKQEEERKKNLQLSAIALFIPLFFLLLLLLSKIRIHHRVIEFMSVLFILFLFEFVTLLIHPVVGKFSNDTPVIEFIIFVCIGAIIVPLHHKFTHWLVLRLTHLRKWEMSHHLTKPEDQENKGN